MYVCVPGVIGCLLIVCLRGVMCECTIRECLTSSGVQEKIDAFLSLCTELVLKGQPSSPLSLYLVWLSVI